MFVWLIKLDKMFGWNCAFLKQDRTHPYNNFLVTVSYWDEYWMNHSNGCSFLPTNNIFFDINLGSISLLNGDLIVIIPIPNLMKCSYPHFLIHLPIFSLLFHHSKLQRMVLENEMNILTFMLSFDHLWWHYYLHL